MYKTMAMDKKEKIRVNYKFSPEFVDRLKKRAKYERRTMTSIVELAVELYIEHGDYLYSKGDKIYIRKDSVGSAGEQQTAKRRPT